MTVSLRILDCLSGIRILDGSVTRIMESKALGHNLDHVDIFSASWGPPDNGKSMDGPKGVTSMVLEEAMANVSLILYDMSISCVSQTYVGV